MNILIDSFQSFMFELWKLFTIFNGNSTYIHNVDTTGIRFSTGIIFSFYLFIIIKMRAAETLKKEHIVAMIGSLILCMRYLTLMFFEWGYRINMYDDKIIYYTYPAVEQFFFMMGIGCLVYYTLHYLDFYPGVLNKILWYIPLIIITIFITNSVEWVQYFNYSLSINHILDHKFCFINWESHIIILISALYILGVAKYKNKISDTIFIFWGLVVIEEILKLYYIYNHFNKIHNTIEYIPVIFNSLQLISLPILSLHFTKTYSSQAKFCVYCRHRFEVL